MQLNWGGRRTTDMYRRLARYTIWVTMSVVGLMLGLAIAYFVHGSLEEFPTDEQLDKVRRVAAACAAALVLVEVALWSLLRRLGRGTAPPRRSVGGAPPPAA